MTTEKQPASPSDAHKKLAEQLYWSRGDIYSGSVQQIAIMICESEHKAVAAALTSFIVTSAQTYALGQWAGRDCAKDMLRCGGISDDEIRAHTSDAYQAEKLIAIKEGK